LDKTKTNYNAALKSTSEVTYNISKFVQFPMLSGMVPVKLLPLTSLRKSQVKQNKITNLINQRLKEGL